MNDRYDILEPFTEVGIITLRPVVDKVRSDIFALPLAVVILASGGVRVTCANGHVVLYDPLFIIGEIDLSVIWELEQRETGVDITHVCFVKGAAIAKALSIGDQSHSDRFTIASGGEAIKAIIGAKPT
jgi:hypothetical protein